MSQPQAFIIPTVLDIAAIMVFAFSGAAAGARRGYDIIGVAALALVTSLGGALMRDGLFLQQGLSPILTDPSYLLAVGAGTLAVVPFYQLICRLQTPLLLFDALGLALYTVVGAQKALLAEIPLPGAVLIGVTNGVGGSILRDIITREEPLLFKPGQYYAATAFVGAMLFVALNELGITRPVPSLTAVGAIFLLRLAAIRFNLRTSRLADPEPGQGI